jgi:hypothetical protein
LKVVTHAITLYAVSVFKLPKGLFERNYGAHSGFWWGEDEENKKCISMFGGSYAFRTILVAWDSEIYKVSTWQC